MYEGQASIQGTLSLAVRLNDWDLPSCWKPFIHTDHRIRMYRIGSPLLLPSDFVHPWQTRPFRHHHVGTHMGNSIRDNLYDYREWSSMR